MARSGRIGEFALIARYFAPLSRGFTGAGDLKNDNAFLPADPRHDLAVKTDTVTAGIDFLADEKPERVAARALRVCLSDLAAGGATPFVYQMSVSLPADWKEGWVARFARGLAADQRRYGIVLCGGDTGLANGPLSITITAFGKVPRGGGLGRTGAKAGDELWVTGTIGDAALGLLAARGQLGDLKVSQRRALEERYRLPRPRSKLGPLLVGVAHATADVSDGLLADVGHIAEASRLAAHVERDRLPLSVAARSAVAIQPLLWNKVLGGGDDYELVIALPQRRRAVFLAAAGATGVRATCIGRLAPGRGVVLTVGGRASRVQQAGYAHF